MAKVLVEDKHQEVNPGPILDACEELGVPFGCQSGVCGTCKSEVLEGMDNLEPKNEAENEMDLKENERLCCQARIKGGSVRLRPLQ